MDTESHTLRHQRPRINPSSNIVGIMRYAYRYVETPLLAKRTHNTATKAIPTIANAISH